MPLFLLLFVVVVAALSAVEFEMDTAAALLLPEKPVASDGDDGNGGDDVCLYSHGISACGLGRRAAEYRLGIRDPRWTARFGQLRR